MALSSLRTNLKLALETIEELNGRVYTHVPPALLPGPVAIIDLDKPAITYTDPGTLATYHFRILLIIDAMEPGVATDKLDDYVDKNGSKSIHNAVNDYWVNNDLANYAVIEMADMVGAITYRGQTLFGAEFVGKAGETA